MKGALRSLEYPAAPDDWPPRGCRRRSSTPREARAKKQRKPEHCRQTTATQRAKPVTKGVDLMRDDIEDKLAEPLLSAGTTNTKIRGTLSGAPDLVSDVSCVVR